MIEAWGRGIELIIEACREAGTPEPEVKYEQTGLWVIFHFLPEHQVFTNAPTSGNITTVTGEVAGEVTGEVTRLLLVCQGALSRRELRDTLQLKGDDNFRRLYLIPALEAGVIEMTVPGKPNSRLQKYRLTAKGEAIRTTLQTGSAT
jgi:ATP-dependent DNA helicase RecG